MKKYSILMKFAAVFTALNIFIDTVLPYHVFALTGGPSSPEFSSFEPVATTNMVNEFTGDFTYNLPILQIPGPDGGGYAMSLSYHTGASPEEEASWVGYGWTLNPGAINRCKKGIPDDWNGLESEFWNKTRPNKTICAGTGTAAEIYSWSFGTNGTLRYNNYKGMGYVVSTYFGNRGIGSLGYTYSDGEGSFSWQINPAGLLEQTKDEQSEKDKSLREMVQDKDLKAAQSMKKVVNRTPSLTAPHLDIKAMAGSKYGIMSLGEEAKPTSMNKFTGLSIDFTLELTQNPPPAEVGLSAELSGNYNYQTNQAVADKPVFGYMYSSNASGDVMDYHFEKATNFNKRDVFIGLPASDNDQYIVTGESLSGGFRLHHATSEYFRPNTTYSNTFLYAQGIGVDLGFCFGGGANSTIGYNLLWMKGMSAYQSSFSNPDDTKIDEPVFFRFNNDRGGTLEYGNENILEPTGGSVNLAGDYRSGRSSYIGYNLNKNMATELNDICYYSYCKDNAVSDFINRSEEALADQVGEFSILNEDGMRYTYGLPVYSRDELNMSYSISGGTGDTYIKYCETDGEQESKIGEYRSNPYTTSYLLTSINTSDYIDRLNDGPTTDDFGGYTRFVYKRLYGSNNKVKENSSDTSWYKWRIPYTGMYFNRNELSRDVDDLCSVSQGEKETYYLDSIITKTHYAVFYTSERDDGYSASINGDDDTDPTATGGKPLHKLDSIGLFAKNATGGKLLKTVKFSYNYDAFPGLPNSINNDGKLTLEKVWFEYNGIYDAWLSPYEFYYQYPNTDYPDGKYDALENYGSGLNEMPSYSKYILDAWSNYQPNGQARYINMQFWPFQGQQLSSDFDPAAWQLKYIKLPSGGEIHVQYEQDDYCYVQDKYAHALVRLTGNDYSNTSTVFSLDVEYDLNIIDNNVKQEIADLINELYGNYKKRIFFKFLYKLIGNATPVLDNKLSEYLSGYAFVESAYVESDILKIKIGAPDNNAGYYIPGQVCLDYYKANCFGRTAENNDISYNIFSDNNPLAIGYRFLDFLNNFEPPSSSEICMKINPELSYFRIPMVTDKRGGGLRVKRLLMFDNGISGGKPSLYGNEYNYRFYDKALNKWRSSGVTTNEPSAMREENALVNIIERGEQTLFSKLISGRDKKQLEGPIGESFLSSPSVGYSRVIINNIHSGPTSPGYIVKEFHTVKDYPLSVDYSVLNPYMYNLPLSIGLASFNMSEYEAWQSFLIKELNMHGQIKSTTAYSGNYVFNSISGEDVTGSSVISQESIEYYDPVKGIPVLDNLDQLETINDWDDLPLKKLGKETEIIRESRFVGETGISTTFEFDVAVGYIPPVEFIGPQFGFACSGSQSLSEMKSYTKTTYITYPVIQKKIISVRDNMRLVSENVAFDKYSGKPIITLTNDGHHALEIAGVEHDGDILNINIPASYYYDQMRQAATNEKLILTSTPERKLFITNVNNKYYLNISSLNQNDLPKYCTGLGVGDLVEIKAVDFPDTTALCHIANVYGNCYKLAETYYSATGNNLALLNGLDVDVRVIRSGCTNQLNLPADNIAIYGHQIPQLSIDEITISGSPMLALANTLNSSNSVQISSISGLDTLLSYPLQSFIVVDIVDNTKSITIKNNNEILCSNILFEPDLFLGGTGTGQFQVDENTGQIVYYSVNNPANPQEIPCLTMSNIIPRTVAISNILSAGANTYSDYWPYNAAIYPGYSQTNAFNNFEKGVRGKCRQNAAYIYNKDATGVISDQNMKNYTTGLFDLVLFNWEYPSANNPEKWLKSVQINKYSPNGNALEEENILHIKSAAKFGYHQALPYLVAANCPYHLCLFESFENQYQYGSNTYFEDGLLYANGSINNDISHSGSSSFNLAPHQFFKLLAIPSSDFSLLETKGFNCMVWVYSLNNNIEPPNLMISEDGDYVASLQMKQSAKIGYWRLYEGTLKTNVSGNEVSIGIEHNNNSLIIDDIRIQPSDAQVNTYVYDVNTHKLITSFDAQHFGLFYQYDAKGQLVRKQKETVRGVKTLQEAEYNNGYKVERSSL